MRFMIFFKIKNQRNNKTFNQITIIKSCTCMYEYCDTFKNINYIINGNNDTNIAPVLIRL